MNEPVSRLTVAVLMPLGSMFDEIFQTVAECGQKIGAQAERVTSEFSKPEMLAMGQSQIGRAHLVVADLTAKNPNVLYQIGYAHAAHKKVILIAQHGEDCPFDRNEHHVIVYAGNAFVLAAELGQRLRREVGLDGESSRDGQSAKSTDVSSGAREKFYSIFGDLLQEHGRPHHGSIQLENPKTFVIQDQDFSLALVQALVRRGNQQGIRLKLL